MKIEDGKKADFYKWTKIWGLLSFIPVVLAAGPANPRDPEVKSYWRESFIKNVHISLVRLGSCTSKIMGAGPPARAQMSSQ